VFRDDLDEPASVEELEPLSNKKCRAGLDAIRDACCAYITGPLREFLGAQLADAAGGAGRVDEADPDAVGYVEKDFWVCSTVNALYHERPLPDLASCSREAHRCRKLTT
jgi:hypothetical protein